MRPECGEQKTTGDSCSCGRSSVKGGVNSASIEARSPACMSFWELLYRCGTRDNGLVGPSPHRGGPSLGLCQLAAGLSISPLRHVVEDFWWSCRALFHCSFTKLAPDFWRIAAWPH